MDIDNNVKDAINELGSAFNEFKKVNDQRLDEIEEKGQATGDTLSKLDKIEKHLDALEDVNQAVTKQNQTIESVKEQVEKFETMVKRPNSGFSAKQVDEAVLAFDQYCRKGIDHLTDVEKKALTVSNDSTGGYLAPPEYVQELLKTVTEISPIRQIARVRSTGQRSVQIPKEQVHSQQLGWQKVELDQKLLVTM